MLRAIEERSIGSLFLAADRVGAAVATTRTSPPATCRSLRKAFYGASIMPGPVLDRLRHALPGAGVLQLLRSVGDRSAGHRAAARGARRAARLVRPTGAVRRARGDRRRRATRWPPAAPARSSTARRSCARATGTSPRRPRRRSAAAGSTPATWCGSTRSGYITVVDRIKDVINTGGVLVASREVEDALYTHPAVAEVAVIGTPGRQVDRGRHRVRGARGRMPR